MTVKIQHLTVNEDGQNYLTGPDESLVVTNDETWQNDILSMVRHIMRDRGDCNRIPVVRCVVTHPVNTYGHNAQIEVTYHTRGFRAIYGAHVGTKVTKVECYMD